MSEADLKTQFQLLRQFIGRAIAFAFMLLVILLNLAFGVLFRLAPDPGNAGLASLFLGLISIWFCVSLFILLD